MVTSIMKLNPIGGILGTNANWQLFHATQETQTAITDNDILLFPNVTEVKPISISSESARVLSFDYAGDSPSFPGHYKLIVEGAVTGRGTASLRVEGLVLAKKI